MPARKQYVVCPDCSDLLCGCGGRNCRRCFGSGVNPHLNSADPECPTCAQTMRCPTCRGAGRIRIPPPVWVRPAPLPPLVDAAASWLLLMLVVDVWLMHVIAEYRRATALADHRVGMFRPLRLSQSDAGIGFR